MALQSGTRLGPYEIAAQIGVTNTDRSRTSAVGHTHET